MLPAHLSEGSGPKVTTFQGGPACDQLPAGLGRVRVALWREVGGASGSTPEHLPTWGLGRDLEQGKAPSRVGSPSAQRWPGSRSCPGLALSSGPQVCLSILPCFPLTVLRSAALVGSQSPQSLDLSFPSVPQSFDQHLAPGLAPDTASCCHLPSGADWPGETAVHFT